MISICIPIYNFNITPLVERLSLQMKQLNEATELILIDDGSKAIYKTDNEQIAHQHTYIPLEKNIGRAAIRNRFLRHTQYDYLLFLDCDSLVVNEGFLSNYVEAIKAYPKSVLCGGREYSTTPPLREKMLRWKYGILKESKPAITRNKHPHASFMTNNFVVPKEVFQSIHFDESLVDYGHEDTLFGFELKKHNIPIVHCNNPILNGDLETNKVFLTNTEKGIANLARILQKKEYDKDLIHDVTLLRVYYKFKSFEWLIRFKFFFLKPLLRNFLNRGYANLWIFDFYKLGTLSVQLNELQKLERDL